MYKTNKDIKTAIFPIAKMYKGDHPIEAKHYYEFLLIDVLGEIGVEAQICDVIIGSIFFKICYWI